MKIVNLLNSILNCVLCFIEQIEEQVVNVILELASADSLDEYRTEAVAVSIICLYISFTFFVQTFLCTIICMYEQFLNQSVMSWSRAVLVPYGYSFITTRN